MPRSFYCALLTVWFAFSHSSASDSVGYYGHPDRIEQKWLDAELKNAVPSERALDACCNIENTGIWFKKCVFWDFSDSYCHYQNKCWAILRKIAYAYYTKHPKEVYQMILDGAANKHKVADYVNCSLSEFNHEPHPKEDYQIILDGAANKHKVADYVNCSLSEFNHEPIKSSCIVRTVCQRYIEKNDHVKVDGGKKSDCNTPLESFKLTENQAMSDMKRCDMNNQIFKLTATDCLRSCHRARLNKVRECRAAVFGPDGHCNMYKDRTMEEGGSCASMPAEGRTLIEMKKHCRIR
uniref:Uncharacterized protein n=1 Tax=Plectus sambesii TaxID=2011161 RepID=A0A914UTR3_9BILA